MQTRLRCAGMMVVALCFGACAPPHVPPVSRAQTLVIGATREPRSLNPLLEEGEISETLGLLLFTFLVTVDERGNQVPEAARSVPTQQNGGISKDGLRVVYHLRRDIRWQDGVPLTARDCAFTFRAIMNPRNDLPSRAGYDVIREVRTPDDATVVVILKRPYSPITDAFLAPDYNYPILPAHVLARYRELNDVPFDAQPLGSGPFRVVRWRRGDALTLVRNDAFFRGRPKLAALTIRFVPSFETIVNQLQTHELDASFGIAPIAYRRLRALPGIVTTLTPVAGAALLYFNTVRGPTADVRIRRALALAIDRPSLVQQATAGVYTAKDPMRGLLAWAYTHVEPAPYAPRAAEQMLELAGWKLAADGLRYRRGERLTIVLIAATTYPSTLTTSLQQAFRQIGVDATIKTFEPATYAAPGAAGGPVFGQRFGAALFYILVGAGDPDTLPYFGCEQRAPHGFNISGFCDPALEAAQRDGAEHFDRSRRKADALVVERILTERVPLVVLAQRRSLDAHTTRLRGFTPAAYTPYWRVWEWSLAEP